MYPQVLIEDTMLFSRLKNAYAVNEWDLIVGGKQIPNYNTYRLQHSNLPYTVNTYPNNGYTHWVNVVDDSFCGGTYPFGQWGITILCASLYDAEEYIKNHRDKKLLRHPYCRWEYFYLTQREDLECYAEWYERIKKDEDFCYIYPFTKAPRSWTHP